VDPASAIVGAIIAGATAATKETASRAVKDAYAGLKQILVDGYHIASLKLLDENPQSRAFKDAAKEEITNSRAIADANVSKWVLAIIDALANELPEQLVKWNISIGDVTGARNVLIEQLQAKGSIKLGDIEATAGDAVLRNLRAGSATGKE